MRRCALLLECILLLGNLDRLGSDGFFAASITAGSLCQDIGRSHTASNSARRNCESTIKIAELLASQ